MKPQNIFLVIMVLILSTCLYGLITTLMKSDEEVHQHKTNRIEASISEVEYDGCQYIVFEGYKKGGIVHKGNCTNHGQTRTN